MTRPARDQQGAIEATPRLSSVLVRSRPPVLMGRITNDVGSTESYDIKATTDGQTIKIEVKGTTSDRSDVVLTFNDVELHGEHPNHGVCCGLASTRPSTSNRA
jgi:hypothetical protein